MTRTNEIPDLRGTPGPPPVLAVLHYRAPPLGGAVEVSAARFNDGCHLLLLSESCVNTNMMLLLFK